MPNHSKSKGRNQISRRAFLSRAVTGTAFFALAPATGLLARDLQQVTPWPAHAPAFRFHMIGHGHIDPVWLWPWTEGISVVHSTFRSALDRMNETPGFCFAASSAQFYQWVAENDTIPIYDGIDDFTINTVDSWKLAAFVKMDAAFTHDASFDIENYLIKRFAKNFGRAEDNAFINGNGIRAKSDTSISLRCCHTNLKKVPYCSFRISSRCPASGER